MAEEEKECRETADAKPSDAAEKAAEEARRVLPEAVGGEAREAFLKAATYIGQRDF